ncbi:MAG TPA: VOC family protein [Kribbella sp.]
MALTFDKISHISFSTRDAEASAAWWKDIFGLHDLDRTAGDGWKAILLLHRASATIIEFQQHEANRGEPFDPTRTGFDHMGLLVRDPAELADWEEHFRAKGVVHTPTVHRDYGSVLTFKDPDGIQFEMFYRANHP